MWRWVAYRCRRKGSEQGDSGTTANSLREVGETESARQAETDVDYCSCQRVRQQRQDQ